MKLSRISLAFLPLLSLCSVQAAVYNVVEVGEVSELKSTSAAAINDAGDSVFNGAIFVLKSVRINGTSTTVKEYQYFNFPIQLDLIDFEDETIQGLFTDEQLADLKNGIVDADTLAILLGTNPGSQPIGISVGYVKAGTEPATNYVMRDTNKSRMNNESLTDINNAGVAVGFATSMWNLESFTAVPTETTPEPEAEDYWVPTLPAQSGYALINGVPVTIEAPYTLYGGGFSSAEAISSNGFIAGFGSVGMFDEAIADVESRCTGEAAPLDLCLYNYQTLRVPNYDDEELAFGYIQRGLVWQLNGSTVSAPKVLGILGDKNTQQPHSREGYNEVNYYSRAYAVNDKGIAVGLSVYSDSDIANSSNNIYRTEHATLFVDDEALPLVDPKDVIISKAVDINNNDIVVGKSLKNVNGRRVYKMFVYDYNTNSTRYIRGFFDSSNTEVNAINDNNQAVGRADTIVDNSLLRRTHGFLYDINTDKFIDLNVQLGCNSPYTIFDAQDINNEGVITATALVEREKKDLQGQVILDSQGNPETEKLTTVVTLQPIANGEVEDCNVPKIEYERKGGSSGFGMLLISSVLLWWRRRQA